MAEKVDRRVKLLAWHLIEASANSQYTADEFQLAIAFLYGWSARDASKVFKKAMLVLVGRGASLEPESQE